MSTSSRRTALSAQRAAAQAQFDAYRATVATRVLPAGRRSAEQILADIAKTIGG